jgi:VIT1/CCC1 family predicted Fe2+/Mn2+ transporter
VADPIVSNGTDTDSRRRAREVQSGTARAAVLGVSDGLVTNVALILGVAGAEMAGNMVLLTGAASLIAGATSMAVGEYVSMAAQVELLKRLLGDFCIQLRRNPEAARQTLEDALVRGGIGPATAHSASLQLALVPEHAEAAYARLLGLDPEELGSPWKAAGTSLLTFAAGALVPLLPWFFWSGTKAAAGSLALGAGAALVIGGALGRLGSNNVFWSALRQLIALTLAASATWGAGRLFKVTVT